MNAVTQHIKWARVAYQPIDAQAAFARLAVANPTTGGLTGAEQVQCAVYLAMLRDLCAANDPVTGPSARIAAWDSMGAPIGFFELSYSGSTSLAHKLDAEKAHGLLVVGDAPFSRFATSEAVFADGTRVTKWGKKLALACDEIAIRIAKGEEEADAPPLATDTVLPIAAVIVIVTGAALAVIGAVAAWRVLDPDFRRDALLVKTAAESYGSRLGVYKATGVMPAPSAVEQAAIPAVESMAKTRATTDWLWGAGIAGGLIVGTVVSVAVAGRK